MSCLDMHGRGHVLQIVWGCLRCSWLVGWEGGALVTYTHTHELYIHVNDVYNTQQMSKQTLVSLSTYAMYV